MVKIKFKMTVSNRKPGTLSLSALNEPTFLGQFLSVFARFANDVRSLVRADINNEIHRIKQSAF